MAETDWGRTNAAGVARVEVNTGPVDLDAAVRVHRVDPHSYPPLYVPVSHPPILEPPGPPLLSEDEKRDRLRAALATQTAAEQALASAERTHLRAREHLRHCQQSMTAFAELEEDIAAATIAQLTDPDCPRVELPPPLQAKLAEREQVRSQCVAAERASEQLTKQLATAREAVTSAASDVRRATIALLGLEAGRLAIEYRAVEEEQDERFTRLAAYDRFAAGVPPLPPRVMDVLVGEPKDRRGKIRGQLDTSEWREAAEKLQAEVSAEPMEVVCP